MKRFPHTAPDNLDPFGEDALKTANLAYDDFQSANEMLAMAEDPRRIPNREAEYRNRILYARVGSVDPFTAKQVWDLNNRKVTEFTRAAS